MGRELCLLFLLLSNIFMLSRTENQGKWKQFHSKEQATTAGAKDNNSDNSWDEDRKIADGLRSIFRNTLNLFSTRAPNRNFTLFDQNGSIGLINRPIRRWRLRVKNRRQSVSVNMKDDIGTVGMQPEKMEQAYEPSKIIPTGLEIVGTAGK